MQAIFPRRQFEHGDSLSQRTFRARHTAQLRRFGPGVRAGVGAGAGADGSLLTGAGVVVAFCSEGEMVTGGSCDMDGVVYRIRKYLAQR